MRDLKKIFFLLSVFFFGRELLCAQRSFPVVEVLTSGTKTSLRGLSVVNDNVVWVSGSAGTVGKTTNGGKNWKWYNVKGFEKREFRDIEAFDATTALIIAVDEPGYILKTAMAVKVGKWYMKIEQRECSWMQWSSGMNGAVR